MPHDLELKPCPFCGGEAERIELTDDENVGGSVVQCTKCSASSAVHFDRKENLFDWWNRRAVSAQDDNVQDTPDYDAGLLNDFGGGDVGWWQDYLRAEIERANSHWRDAVSTLSTPKVEAVEPIADIVPDGCTSVNLVFAEGVLCVNKDGSGYIAVDEKHWDLEDDRCEGPDGPEGSVHWITKFPPGEMEVLRDFLNGAPISRAPALTDEVVERAADAIWNEFLFDVDALVYEQKFIEPSLETADLIARLALLAAFPSRGETE